LSAAKRAGERQKVRGGFEKKLRQKLENDVDAETGPAKVTLPLITADSQVSEWFCEHAATASVSKRPIRPMRGKGWSDAAKRDRSSLIVWFSEFLGRWAGSERRAAKGSARRLDGFALKRSRFGRNFRKRSTEQIEAKIELCVIRRVFEG
jgi:hypothetical protein